MTQKKQHQLGMNPSTASGRLVKDILFNFIEKAGHKCFVCDKELTRDTFSIEHKEAWLDSQDPVGLYFDLDNIAFSHLTCNISASRPRPPSKYFTTEARLEGYAAVRSAANKRSYTPEKRRARYLESKTDNESQL